MKRKNSGQIITTLLLIFAGVVTIWVVLKFVVNTSADTAAATEPPAQPTEPVIMAVARDDVVCYFGNNLEYQITISKLVIVGILEKNGPGDLVKVRLNEVIDCWVPVNSLELNNHSLASIPFANVTFVIPTATTIPTPTPLPGDMTPTPPSRLIMRWKILSYDCGNGKATGATIDLDVSGGVPEYSFSPSLPIYAKPGQFISITVKSKTNDGEPSGVITFTVPEALNKSEFKCDKTDNGNNPLPPPPPTEDPPTEEPEPTSEPTDEPTGEPTDQPTEEPVCYNPAGKVIKCKKDQK